MKNSKGFTLLELLLAVSILALISAGIAAGLTAGIRAWESGERNLDKYQRMRIVSERLIREIGSAISMRGKKEDDEYWRLIFNGESDSISFISTAEMITSPGLPLSLKETHIFVNPDEGLIIKESMLSRKDFFSDESGNTYVLDPYVSGIKFRYLYIPYPDEESGLEGLEGEWLDTWGPEHIEIQEVVEEEDKQAIVKNREVKNKLPMAVEVTITALDPETGNEYEWDPLIISLGASKVMGVSIKRRPRKF